jgi:hypothetical protein
MHICHEQIYITYIVAELVVIGTDWIVRFGFHCHTFLVATTTKWKKKSAMMEFLLATHFIVRFAYENY